MSVGGKVDLFSEAATIYSSYVDDWKKKGGKVLGYGCLYTPVELIEAAGLLPYRLKAMGNTETDLADAHLSLYNCGFCRSVLQLALDGSYDFLDGVMETNGCDHMRLMWENWQHAMSPKNFHYLRIPHTITEETLGYLVNQLELFKDFLSKTYGVEISAADIKAAMARMDSVRNKLGTLYAMRERPKPAITGSEILALQIVGGSMRSEDFDALLSEVIAEKEGVELTGYKARIMVCGAIPDQISVIEAIEDLGGLVVADSLCVGSRAFWKRSGAGGGEPLRTLAEEYLNSIMCPRMFVDYAKRRDFAAETAKRANVEGIIYYYNKFCDLHGSDSAVLRRDMEELGYPVLVLEAAYGVETDMGRIRTRVQALLERIGG